MNKKFRNKLKGTMVVPFGLAIVLAPYSMLLGWNGPDSGFVLACGDPRTHNLFADASFKQ